MESAPEGGLKSFLLEYLVFRNGFMSLITLLEFEISFDVLLFHFICLSNHIVIVLIDLLHHFQSFDCFFFYLFILLRFVI
jgi:hypothetical protein